MDMSGSEKKNKKKLGFLKTSEYVIQMMRKNELKIVIK